MKRKRWLLVECEADARLFCAKEGCPGIAYELPYEFVPKKKKGKAEKPLPVVIREKPANNA
jgi:hypothetical protein